MRDLLVTAIVVGALPFVLKHAYIGVLLWTWLSIMNPHRMTWSFAYNMPFAAIAAGATLLSLLTTRDPVRLPKSPLVPLLIAFNVWMCVTTALAISPLDSLPLLERVLKIQLMTLVALAVLHDRRHIQLFVWINVLSLGFFGLKGGVYTLGGGSGLVSGPGGFLGGNTQLGLALVMVIPLMNYLRLTTNAIWIRYGVLLLMVLTAAAVFGTQSRGAFLAICAMALFLWWRSPQKLVFGGVIVASAVFLLGFMADSWIERMQSIQHYEYDGSAMGRINAWWTMFNLANDRITGGGFEIYNDLVYGRYAPDPSVPRAAHSIYFQILGEHGWPGLLLFIAIWLLVWRCASRLRTQCAGNAEYAWVYHLAGMSQVALVGYAVGGAFLSMSYFDLPYNILVMLVVTERWLAVERQVRQQAGSDADTKQPASARLRSA